MMDEFQKKMMRKAIQLSIKNIESDGGPFGAVIVKDGKEIASGVNRVTKKNDPTAHAEMTAIRRAAKKLNDFNLSGCEIFTSCEPCPMCLSAIYWARIDKIYYANTKEDAKKAGFDDSFIYHQLELPEKDRSIPVIQLLRYEATHAFSTWSKKIDKTEY
jgi:tRNA(Arg) A34 adenosine deaminase TadA